MKTVELLSDQVDKIIVDDLYEAAKGLLDDPWSYKHSYVAALDMFNSMITVLTYYGTQDTLEKLTVDGEKLLDLYVKADREDRGILGD